MFLTFLDSRFGDQNTDADSTNNTSDCHWSDLQQEYVPTLSCVKNLKNPDLYHITPEVLLEMVKTGRSYLIVDCRYDYEFQGGHIPGAINIRSPQMLERVFFTNRHMLQNAAYLQALKENFDQVVDEVHNFEFYKNQYPEDSEVPVIIFHCEFSQKRGPRALRALRNMDREINHTKWPFVFYNEVYILDGGYKNFHGQFKVN